MIGARAAPRGGPKGGRSGLGQLGPAWAPTRLAGSARSQAPAGGGPQPQLTPRLVGLDCTSNSVAAKPECLRRGGSTGDLSSKISTIKTRWANSPSSRQDVVRDGRPIASTGGRVAGRLAVQDVTGWVGEAPPPFFFHLFSRQSLTCGGRGGGGARTGHKQYFTRSLPKLSTIGN